MKVLLIHNYYRSSAPSGEDAVYANEREYLDRNIAVVPYEKYNDDIDDRTLIKKIGLALNGVWSRRTYREMARLIRKTGPDVAHFHNIFPQISPSGYAACRDNGVPVVQTLHNYRFICPNALLLRNGRPCEDCIAGNLLPALRHRCYRGSLPATGAQVLTIAGNRLRGTYEKQIDRYIALTGFAVGRFVAGGIPENKIVIKNNFLPDVPAAGSGAGGYAIYVGRLSEEKGVRTLLNAWKNVQGRGLKVVGDGPLRHELEQRAARDGLPVEFLGYCDREKTMQWVGAAALQVVPSEWYEGFPMVVLEAYASGTPVVASAIGSLDEIVAEGETGFKFPPGDAAALAAALNRVFADQPGLERMRRRVRRRFLDQYTAEKNIIELLDIYRNTIADHERI